MIGLRINSEKDELTELRESETHILKSIYGESLDNLLAVGNVLYLDLKNEEYFFRVLGVFGKNRYSEFVLKTLQVEVKNNQIVDVSLRYLLLDTVIKEDRLIPFGPRFPKAFKEKLDAFLNLIKDDYELDGLD